MVEMDAFCVEQQNGAEYSGQLRLDEAHEAIQHILEPRVRRDHFQNLRLPVAQDVRLSARGDVPGDAHQTDDLVVIVAQRHFGRRKPLLDAGAIDDRLFHVDHRSASPDDVLLDVEKLLSDFRRVEIEVAQPAQIGRIGAAIVNRDSLVGDNEAAFRILDEQIIRHAINQRLQGKAFVRMFPERPSKRCDLATKSFVDRIRRIGRRALEVCNMVVAA